MKRILQTAVVVLSTLFLFSCGKKNDNAPAPAAGSDASWKFGTYTYTRGASAQSSSASNGTVVTAIACTTAGPGNYGAYSGSSLTITFYSNLGTGKYTLGTTEAMVANPGSRIIVIDCTIGTAVNTGSLLYSYFATGATATADVTKDSNGKFHVTMSAPVTFKKNIAVNGGIPDAKDTYDLTINNAY
ncbi:hypothetical protein [Chitinophaga vietnamensis]|uniref:hypothetical protein n=1 Tax=Chitinophaga vietnamensis TaxID=2593957 RepID=UPI001178B6F1|nr:hypothetical protein [Chitinophaga vietnamensis]